MIKNLSKIKGLLIYPPNQLTKTERARPDGSLGLLYLAAALEKEGISTDILDSNVGTPEQTLKETLYRNMMQESGLIKTGMSFEEIADYVSKKGYDFVGISSNFTAQTKMALETAKAIKQVKPEIKIYGGGINARALKEKFLESGYFDGICLTDGELIFPKMLKAEFSDKSLHEIAGVAFIHECKIIVNPVDESCFPENIDDLPMPAWEKLPFDKYEEINSPHGVDVTGSREDRYAPIITSRGCAWKCLYCHNSKEECKARELRFHSVERVIKEIDRLQELGVKKLFFQDDSLFRIKERAKQIFKIIEDRGLVALDVNGINLIDCYIREEENGKWKIDKEFLEILKNGGFEQMVFPPESGSQRILDKYCGGKVKLDKMDLPLLMKTMTEMGIKAPVNVMLGFPDETKEEMQETIALAKKLKELGAPYVTFFGVTPFPGSKLYDISVEKGYISENFDPDIMNYRIPLMKNTTVPPQELEIIRKKAHEETNGKEFDEKMYKKTVGFQMGLKKD